MPFLPLFLESKAPPLLTNDAIILGILVMILAFIFVTAKSQHPFWKKLYTFVPPILLAYFLPSLLTSFGIVDPEVTQLYTMAKNYLLPASLVLLTLSIDLKGIFRLGPKALIMFFTATVGIIVGGPLAILLFQQLDPATVAGDTWRGMTTVAGSWIGGGANQAAMKEVFEVKGDLFSMMITVDVIVANVWMAVLLYGAGRSDKIDRSLKADNSSIKSLQKTIEDYRAGIAKLPTMPDTMKVLAAGLGATALAHLVSGSLAPWLAENYPGLKDYSLTSGFFWLIVLATTIGLILSFTPARKLEGVGASRIGSVFIYILVATIGLHMDITAIAENPTLFAVGLSWMAVHVILLLSVAKLVKAPWFFVAVGSQANVGGAASAPVVAAAFSESLAPVGVLLAVLGYALGTYGAYICGILMQAVAQ